MCPGGPPVTNTILDLSARELGGVLVLQLEGEFDLAGVGAVENTLDRVSRPPPLTRVVFDLSGLDFLDLAGLKTILRADERGRQAGWDVVVVRPRGPANRVFTLTRAGETLGLVDRLDQA